MTTLDQFGQELGQLRSQMAKVVEITGEIRISCAVLVERSARTEQDVRDLREDLEKDIRDLRRLLDEEIENLKDDEIKPVREDVDELKERRWPLPSIAIVAGIIGAISGIIALFQK